METLTERQKKEQDRQLARLDFEKRHGESVTVDTYTYYADGAVREAYTEGKEPPVDLVVRFINIARFWEAKLALVTLEFEDQKRAWLADAEDRLKEENPGGPPVERAEAVRILTELANKVQTCRQKLREARAKLREFQPDKITQEEVAEENRMEMGEFLRDIRAIEI